MVRVPAWDLRDLGSNPFCTTGFLCDLGQLILSLYASADPCPLNGDNSTFLPDKRREDKYIENFETF